MGNSKKKYTIGIDIGGTKILTCLLTKDFKVCSEIKVKTRPEKGERFFIKSLVDTIHFVLRDAKISVKDVLGIGIGCPGFIDPDKGVIAGSPNIPFLKNFALAKRLSKIGRAS